MKESIKKAWKVVSYSIAAFVFLCGASVLVYGAVTQIAGLAVAGPGSTWTNLKDAAKFTDPQTNGIGSAAVWLYTGVGQNFERLQGSGANGMIVQQKTVGAAFYANKRTDIAAASVNLPFGFTSRKVAIEFPLTNTDEVCVDWSGGTAVCPAANTDGDDRFLPGDTILIDDFAQTSLSFISASGTQTIYVRAWN